MSEAATEGKLLPDFGRSFRDYQMRILQFQKSAFDAGFEAFDSAQDQQGQYVTDLVSRTAAVPEEGKEIINEWVETFQRGREEYKDMVDKSYDFMVKYVAGIGTGSENSGDA